MTSRNPLLILFDGHALIHRGFHALPNLTTRKGQPTGAVYGFASMLLKVLTEFKPAYCAVTFDSAAPTFRHIQFEDYKAQRPKAPDDLISQFGVVRELVRAFNIPAFEIEGYEADDILGTISKHTSIREIETIIVTGDTDILQLVSPKVQVLMPLAQKSFSETQLYDEEAVRQKYNLMPFQLSDLKGLVGDPSDNIPGVPGIGKKTASKLLSEFATIEDIYRRIDEVTPAKLQQKLRENEAIARQSKDLATIVTDAPVDFDLAACDVSDYDRNKVVELFRNLEFFSLLEKLPSAMSESQCQPTGPKNGSTNYKVVDTTEKLDELVNEISTCPILAIDTETTSINARYAKLVGISISSAAGKSWYIPVGHNRSGEQMPLSLVSSRLQPILANTRISKAAHNAKYDMTVLSRHGIEVKNLNFDTMIAAYLLGEKSLGLKQLVFSKLGIEMTPITELIGAGNKQISMAEVDINCAADYACADADMTFRLCQVMQSALIADGMEKLFFEVEMPLVSVLRQMEENGVALDTELLAGMSDQLAKEIEKSEKEIYAWVGHEFNLNSSQQLGKVLFEELKLPTSRKTKSGYSTDASVLEGLKGIHPVVGYLLDYRQLSKLKSTYVDTLPTLVDPDTGRVHTSFNQTVAATGRLSSSDPNLQNIPIRTEIGRKIRQAFIAPGDDCFLISADYSQVELRVLAYLSQDPNLLAAFANDEDIHTATAAQVFNVAKEEVNSEKRRIAKVVNFGVIYGMSDYGLEQATSLSRQEAADFIDSYFKRYSKVKEYLDSTKKQAIEKGYVQTVLGRRRYIPEIKSSDYQVRQAAERMAINMPVQGTAADIIKLAMIRIQDEITRRHLQSKMIIQVHDELVFEVPQREIESMKQLVQEIMPSAMEIGIPLKVDMKIGRNWGEAE